MTCGGQTAVRAHVCIPDIRTMAARLKFLQLPLMVPRHGHEVNVHFVIGQHPAYGTDHLVHIWSKFVGDTTLGLSPEYLNGVRAEQVEMQKYGHRLAVESIHGLAELVHFFESMIQDAVHDQQHLFRLPVRCVTKSFMNLALPRQVPRHQVPRHQVPRTVTGGCSRLQRHRDGCIRYAVQSGFQRRCMMLNARVYYRGNSTCLCGRKSGPNLF